MAGIRLSTSGGASLWLHAVTEDQEAQAKIERGHDMPKAASVVKISADRVFLSDSGSAVAQVRHALRIPRG